MPLQTTVTTDRSQYPPTRAVEILVRMTNTGKSPVAYRVSGRLEYEIRIRESRSRRVVWTWSRGKMPLAPFTVQLQPGQWRQHLELWDGRDDSGKRLPAGVYEIEATHYPEAQSDTIQIYLSDRGVEPPGGGGGGSTVETLVGVLRADRTTAKPGERVALTYTVTHRGKEPITLAFSSGKHHEIEVRDSRGGLVWSHSRDQIYLQALNQVTLAPGESRTFRGLWQVGLGAEGPFSLLAFLTPTQGTLARASTVVTVKKER